MSAPIYFYSLLSSAPLLSQRSLVYSGQIRGVRFLLLSIGAGLTSFAFSRSLTAGQQHLSTKLFLPSHWSQVWPFTFKLWGTGLIILGIVHLSGF